MAWKVPDQWIATQPPGHGVAAGAAATMRSARRSISAAARRENVSSRMRPRIGAVDDQVGDPVGERIGLARAGAGDDQQRGGDVAAARDDAVLDARRCSLLRSAR